MRKFFVVLFCCFTLLLCSCGSSSSASSSLKHVHFGPEYSLCASVISYCRLNSFYSRFCSVEYGTFVTGDFLIFYDVSLCPFCNPSDDFDLDFEGGDK